MTKLIRTLIAGLTVLGVLSVSSIANATQNDEGSNYANSQLFEFRGGGIPADASSQLFEFGGGGIPADAAAKIKLITKGAEDASKKLAPTPGEIREGPAPVRLGR